VSSSLKVYCYGANGCGVRVKCLIDQVVKGEDGTA
jgi:hypothetical protein